MKRLFFISTLVLFGFGCSSAQVFDSTQEEHNIQVENLDSGEIIENPFHIKGKARTFEQDLNWRLLDSEGNSIKAGFTGVRAIDAGQFGDFDFWVVVPEIGSKDITLELFTYSAKDGSQQDLVSIPLKAASTEVSEVELYYLNNLLDPEITCVKAWPVKHRIMKTEAVARSAMLMLLDGPSAEEKSAGYSSVIPFPSYLSDIYFEDSGRIVVDFYGGLEGPFTGECYVNAVRTQIENTLYQFKNVNDVLILIGGRDDKLDP